MSSTSTFTEKRNWLTAKYNEFNSLCFEGSLPLIPFRFTRANTFGGKLQYKRLRKPFGKEVHTDYVLVLDVSHDRTEAETEDILLHEMIHFYIEHHHLKDTSSHGPVFRKMMNDINQRFGRHITISLKANSPETDTRIRPHWVGIIMFSDNKLGVTVTGQGNFLSIHQALQTARDIDSVAWFISMDSFFNRFPHVRTPKVYRADKEELMQHLQGATPIRFDGKRWVVEVNRV